MGPKSEINDNSSKTSANYNENPAVNIKSVIRDTNGNNDIKNSAFHNALTVNNSRQNNLVNGHNTINNSHQTLLKTTDNRNETDVNYDVEAKKAKTKKKKHKKQDDPDFISQLIVRDGKPNQVIQPDEKYDETPYRNTSSSAYTNPASLNDDNKPPPLFPKKHDYGFNQLRQDNPLIRLSSSSSGYGTQHVIASTFPVSTFYSTIYSKGYDLPSNLNKPLNRDILASNHSHHGLSQPHSSNYPICHATIQPTGLSKYAPAVQNLTSNSSPPRPDSPKRYLSDSYCKYSSAAANFARRSSSESAYNLPLTNSSSKVPLPDPRITDYSSPSVTTKLCNPPISSVVHLHQSDPSPNYKPKYPDPVVSFSVGSASNSQELSLPLYSASQQHHHHHHSPYNNFPSTIAAGYAYSNALCFSSSLTNSATNSTYSPSVTTYQTMCHSAGQPGLGHLSVTNATALQAYHELLGRPSQHTVGFVVPSASSSVFPLTASGIDLHSRDASNHAAVSGYPSEFRNHPDYSTSAPIHKTSGSAPAHVPSIYSQSDRPRIGSSIYSNSSTSCGQASSCGKPTDLQYLTSLSNQQPRNLARSSALGCQLKANSLPSNVSAVLPNPTFTGQSALASRRNAPQCQDAKLGVGCSLSVSELRGMASRQQEQIEAQQQLLVAREQRLKFLKQQQQQGGPGGGGMVAPDHDRLRRMRDRVDAQEAKLRRLRALRGQVDSTRLSTASLTSDLDAMRQMFSQKEKEMVVAVARVDELTRQLEALRTNSQGGGAHRPGGGQGPDHHNELDKLRRELLYRNSVNRESSGRVTSQRDLLSAKTQELARLDKRIAELQTRLHRKKMLNHQLAQQITKATQAKQAQLRAVKEKSSREGVVAQAPHTNTGAPPTAVQPTNGNDVPEITDDNVIRGTVPSEELSEFGGGKQDPKYQTLPYNTKLCHRYPAGGNGAGATASDTAGSYAAQNTYHPSTENYPPSSTASGGENYNTNVSSGGNINSNTSSSSIVNNNSNAAVVANTSNIYNNNNPNNNSSNANAATPTGLVAQLSQTFEATMAMQQQQQQHQTVSDFLSNYSNNNNSNSATTNNSINSNLSSISTLSSNSSGSNNSNSSGVTRTVHSIPMNRPSRGHALAPVTTSAAASGSSTASSLAVVASTSPSTAPATAASSAVVTASAVKTTTVHANSRSMSLSQQHQQQKQQYQQQQQQHQQDMSAELQQQQEASSQYSVSSISKPALPPKPAPPSGVNSGISTSSTTTTSPSTINQSVQPPISSLSSTMAPSTPFNGITTSHSSNKPATPPRLKGDPGGSGVMVENNSKAGDSGNKFTSRGYNQSQATTATTKNLTTISKSASKLPVSSNRINGSSKGDSASTLSSTSLIASTISSLQARSSGSAPNGTVSASTRDKESPVTDKSNHGAESSEDTNASNNSSNNTNSTSSNNVKNYPGSDPNSSSDPGSQNREGDDGQETSDHLSQQQLQYQTDSRNGGGKGPEKGVHVSINRRIEMPPDFLFPENETPPSDLLGRVSETVQEPGSEDALDRATGPQQNDGLTDQLMEQKTGEGGRPGGVARRKGNLKTQGSLRLPRRVSFDPLALLLDASLEGELELVKRTAMEVPNPSAANDEGITALHNAICAGHLDIVTFLVTFGCDVNAQDSDGWTPLHCAASCNNLAMVRFLVEHGACILATTLSDHETPAEKCEQDEEGYDGCSQYLYSIQEKLGILNGGLVYAVYDYSSEQADELSFKCGDAVTILRRGDEYERDWWWGQLHVPHTPLAGETGSGGGDQPKLGYLPRNLLGLYPRVKNPVFSGNDGMES